MIRALVLAILYSCVCFAQSPRIYIEPDAQGGFDSYLSAAMIKKHVPAVVTQKVDDAAYILNSRVMAKGRKRYSKGTWLFIGLLRRGCGHSDRDRAIDRRQNT